MRQRHSSFDALSGPSILFAASPLIVPMKLRLSSLKLRAIVVLVISRMDGITLVFKNDPLESVSVSSTFDSVAAIQAFVQKEIEGQLRELFRSDLPAIVHKLSQEFVKGEVKHAAQDIRGGGFASGAKIHTHSTFQRPSASLSRGFSTLSLHEQSAMPEEAVADPSDPPSPRQSAFGDSSNASVLDGIASYDPTYGLRPEHPPLIGRLDSYKRLVKHASMGIGAALSDVQEDVSLEEAADPDDSMRLNLTGSSDTFVDRGEGPSSRPYGESSYGSAPPSVLGFSRSESTGTMETFRAVGGGTVTRPRVLHTHSNAQLPSASTASGSVLWSKWPTVNRQAAHLVFDVARSPPPGSFGTHEIHVDDGSERWSRIDTRRGRRGTTAKAKVG